MPYLLAGVAGLSAGLVIIVLTQQLIVLVLGAMLVSAFANVAQAVWQAFIPDHVPLNQHGRAAGVKTVMELTGVVLGVATAGFFLARGILWGAPLIDVLLFWLSAVIVVLVLPKSGALSKMSLSGSPLNPFSTWRNGLKQAPPAFLWWMANRVLFWAAAISVRTFLLNYLEDVVGISPAEAQAMASQIFVILGLGVFVLALPAGIVADRVGRRPVIASAGLMAAIGTLIAVFYHDITALYVAGALIATGAGIYASASWALATHLAPGDQGALYLGLANGATVLGSIGGRTGGILIDTVNQLFGTVILGYQINFGVAILFFLASSVMVTRIDEPLR
jgi:MFS family permease